MYLIWVTANIVGLNFISIYWKVILTKPQHLKMMQSLSTIRAECVKHLAIGHSLIPYDILTEVIESELNGEELSIKQLFAKLPYSDMGIRYHIRQLTTKGWIVTNETKCDKRVKTIHSQEKLRVQFGLLRKALNSVLNLSWEIALYRELTVSFWMSRAYWLDFLAKAVIWCESDSRLTQAWQACQPQASGRNKENPHLLAWISVGLIPCLKKKTLLRLLRSLSYQLSGSCPTLLQWGSPRAHLLVSSRC